MRNVIRNVIMRLIARAETGNVYFSKSHIPESQFSLNRFPLSQPFPFTIPSSHLADCSFSSFADIATILFAALPIARPPPTLVHPPVLSYFCPLPCRAALPSHPPTTAAFLRTGRKSARDFYFRT